MAKVNNIHPNQLPSPEHFQHIVKSKAGQMAEYDVLKLSDNWML